LNVWKLYCIVYCYVISWIFYLNNWSKHALKQRLAQNRWLLPLCWLCNPETSFPIPFVDFQRGDLHISDYIICANFLHYVIRIHPFNIGTNIHQGCLSAKIHEFVWNSFSGSCSDYIFRTRGIFGKNRAREKSHRVGKVTLK